MTTSKPTVAQVRSWMQQRQVDRSPPPSLEEVGRQLGWELVAAEREMTNQSRETAI